MNAEDLERMISADPLAVRLQQLDVGNPPPAAGVLARQPFPPENRKAGIVAALNSWKARAGLAAGALVIVALVITATPAGPVVASTILPSPLQQRLGLVSGAPTVIPRPKGAHPGVLVTPNLSFAQAQAEVTFTIPTPHDLPPGVEFRAALVESSKSVHLVYGRGGEGGIGLTIDHGQQNGGPAAPSVQLTEVNGSPAYFVRGDYEDSGPGTAGRWNPRADAEELTWQASGNTYVLTAGGLDLSEKALKQIADSVQ